MVSSTNGDHSSLRLELHPGETYTSKSVGELLQSTTLFRDPLRWQLDKLHTLNLQLLINTIKEKVLIHSRSSLISPPSRRFASEITSSRSICVVQKRSSPPFHPFHPFYDFVPFNLLLILSFSSSNLFIFSSITRFSSFHLFSLSSVFFCTSSSILFISISLSFKIFLA